jgi:hypothetical protein
VPFLPLPDTAALLHVGGEGVYVAPTLSPHSDVSED